MTQDAFELLQEANPLPEDPPPLPIAPLLERVEQLPPLPPVGKGPDREVQGTVDADRGGRGRRRGARVDALDHSRAARQFGGRRGGAA